MRTHRYALYGISWIAFMAIAAILPTVLWGVFASKAAAIMTILIMIFTILIVIGDGRLTMVIWSGGGILLYCVSVAVEKMVQTTEGIALHLHLASAIVWMTPVSIALSDFLLKPWRTSRQT